MRTSNVKKKIQDRRSFVYKQYQTDKVSSVQELVERLAKKFGVSTITIYSDIKIKKGEDNHE